ncbi:MAG: phosphoribosylformylglycinamidine synthase subunit PurS [Cyanobacteriota bacterium]|nr:phosphoribosylformylglycinamidine synthase subunit PurS [Cyanobacteriota bacterium]
MQFRVHITISLRPSILDPAGTAVQASLHQLGHTDVNHLRIGKAIEMILPAADPETAERLASAMCEQLLVNPVIENYQIRVEALLPTPSPI